VSPTPERGRRDAWLTIAGVADDLGYELPCWPCYRSLGCDAIDHCVHDYRDQPWPLSLTSVGGEQP
jgi:hypothetical protein